MIFLILVGIILPAIILVFIIAPVKLKIIYRRKGRNDYMAIELLLLWGRLPIRLELTSFRGPVRIFQPLVKIRAKLTSKGKKPVTSKKESLSPSRLYRLSRRSRYYIKLFYPALEYMGKNTSLIQFRWETKLGFQNAASTGMVTGALWTVKGLFSSILYRVIGKFETYPQLKISPVYNQKVFTTELDCIFEARPGHIIISGLKMIKLWLISGMSPGSEKQYARPAPN